MKVEVGGPPVTAALLAPRAALDIAGEKARANTTSGVVDVKLGPCDMHRCVVTSGLVEGARLRPFDGESR